MSDTYQAIYDAARSKIGRFDGHQLAEEITRQFDISHAVYLVQNSLIETAYEQQRSSILLRPSLSIDGNQWCALYGDNLQDGVAGFGDTPEKALLDFDKNMNKPLSGSNEATQ